MRLAELRTKLADALSDSLGTFANGQPAIWSGESEMPSGLANGIQCNIQPVPIANKNSHPVSGGMVYLDQSWRVTLVNYDRAQSMAPAISKIQQLKPRDPVYLPATSKTFEQYSFELFDPGFVGREDLKSAVESYIQNQVWVTEDGKRVMVTIVQTPTGDFFRLREIV